MHLLVLARTSSCPNNDVNMVACCEDGGMAVADETFIDGDGCDGDPGVEGEHVSYDAGE